MSLIIVESPTKARTFNRILKNNGHFVYATMGHLRDLPKKRIAIDYLNNFKPDYEIIATKEKIVLELKKLAEQNKEIILATDLDREGEAIAYHTAYILGFISEKWPNATIKNAPINPPKNNPIQKVLSGPVCRCGVCESSSIVLILV